MEIVRDLASTLDLETLLDRITRAAADITDCDAASIILYDETAKQLFFQASTNMDQHIMRGFVVPLENSIAGSIVQNRAPLRINDVTEDTRHFKQVGQTLSKEIHSLMGVPLITKDKVIGVLEAINKKEGDFTDTDQDLLTVLGAQAAVAIENTRLFQQSDLIAEFVHELRTPLASVSMAATLLLRKALGPDESAQTLESIHEEAHRLSTLASSFLDLARLESGRVQYHKVPFDFHKVADESVFSMQAKAEEYGLKIIVDIPANMPPAEGDRDKIKQIVINLLSNAIKYNRPNGTVTLKAEVSDKETIITVQDTGVGIPEEDLPNMFQKFFRVKGTEKKAIGTGLGLSICKQIVQGHNGRIEIKSKVNEGTAFILHFPRQGYASA